MRRALGLVGVFKKAGCARHINIAVWDNSCWAPGSLVHPAQVVDSVHTSRVQSPFDACLKVRAHKHNWPHMHY
eukprot:scaffold168078_cov17-Tisochrysis_lutea.AAC.3